MRPIYAIVALLLLASVASAQPSRIILHCPPDAVVKVNGQPTKSTGSERWFDVWDGEYEVSIVSSKTVYSSKVKVKKDERFVIDALPYFGGRAVSRQASPFSADPSSADGKDEASVDALWPKGVERPPTLTAYKMRPAYQPQMIMSGNRWLGFWPTTHGDSPNRNERWGQPGGLFNIDRREWRNITFVSFPKNAKVDLWTESTPVEGTSDLLPKLTWEFPNGTAFYELLVNANGKAFELRQRRKDDGKWHSSVLFKSRLHAPVGYVGVKAACNSCHNSEVGRATGYGVGVRGSDTVISWYPVRDDQIPTTTDLSASSRATDNSGQWLTFITNGMIATDDRWPINQR